MIIKVINQSYSVGYLSPSQRTGILSLMYKKDDKNDLKNWRPITLLNVDYKILASCLAHRLKKVLPHIINTDQNGFIKNRYIGFNIRQIQDIIDNAENFKIDGAILFLDFKKLLILLNGNFCLDV